MSRPVVWVAPYLDAPAHGGGELRTTRLLKALSAVCVVDVALLDPHADAAAVAVATGAREVRQLGAWPRPLTKRGRALRRRLPLPAAAVLDPRLVAWVARRASGAVVVADHLLAAPYLSLGARSVLSLHNADAQLLRELPTPDTRVRRAEHRWDLAVTPGLQRRALTRADRVVCVSEQDRALLRADALVVPNGADLPPAPTPVPRGGSVLFVGSMSYPPNLDAVRWWREHVAPRLPEDLPPLTVVGRDAARVLGGAPGLEVHGDVADVRPFLEAASVVVVPLRHGGGSRLKVVEALGHGRPLVATVKGVEGFPVVAGEHALVHDDAAAFAGAVTQAYRDVAAADRLAAAGRALAEAYDWDTVAAPFVAMVRELAR